MIVLSRLVERLAPKVVAEPGTGSTPATS
jgi:hypothetical protein